MLKNASKPKNDMLYYCIISLLHNYNLLFFIQAGQDLVFMEIHGDTKKCEFNISKNLGCNAICIEFVEYSKRGALLSKRR